MKIIIREGKDEDGCIIERLVVDDIKRKSVGPLWECPEDAIIGRSLVSCRDIAIYMREAHAAGKRGEEFTIETLPMEEEE